ncbi:hypothetical protein GGQ97_002434 [Sphingomonas kaistensis]|uniref:DUF4175 domain-containing protein n=1 Tax=Sphingomonas kaistensis TaxID=298708 RepID=A0A7X5YAN4_9SPHN|nr:hypothetical protein [Sphingomonas kaistensis]NJC06641.1 hypothetical protein [Sphingomonas kaistensis]
MIRSTFALPAVLALLSLAGLLSALTGDGWRDLLSWTALSVPLLAIAWAASRRSPRKDDPK